MLLAFLKLAIQELWEALEASAAKEHGTAASLYTARSTPRDQVYSCSISYMNRVKREGQLRSVDGDPVVPFTCISPHTLDEKLLYYSLSEGQQT